MGSSGPDLGSGLLGGGSLFDSGAADDGVGLLGGGGTFAPPRFGMGDVFAGSAAATPFVPSMASIPSMGSARTSFGGSTSTFAPPQWSQPPSRGAWPGASDTVGDTPTMFNGWPAPDNGTFNPADVVLIQSRNQRQNAMVRAVQVQLGLTEDQRDWVHRAISGQDHTYQEIFNIAKDRFGERPAGGRWSGQRGGGRRGGPGFGGGGGPGGGPLGGGGPGTLMPPWW
jgi:hypothetical protein